MTESKSVISEMNEELRSIADDVLKMLLLKQQLAEQEIRHDVRVCKKLMILGGVGTAIALVGVPVLITSLALLLDGAAGFSAGHWALLFSIPLVACGATAAWTAWSRFRRDFLGLRESMEELREDLNCIRQWLE